MKHILIGIIASLLISCGSPAAAPTIQPTREEPKKAAPVNIIVDTATATVAATGTYTPIPATFTLTPTKNIHRSLSTPGVISGSGDEIIDLKGELPGHISVSTTSDIQIYLILADGQRVSASTIVDSSSKNPVVALQIICSGDWSVKTSPDNATSTIASTATRKPTLKATVLRSAPTLAVIPTKKPTAVIIPTVFLPPTDVPPPAPKTCCKHCTPGKSKACGDSCIGIDKTCHQPPGCAC